jgi:hypothetical protein
MTLKDKAIKSVEKQARQVVLGADQPDARKMLEQWGRGYKQDASGKAMAQFIEDFLGLLSAEQRKSLESDIDNLPLIKNPKKFRTKAITIAAIAFQYGFNVHKTGKDFDLIRMIQDAAAKVGLTEGF